MRRAALSALLLAAALVLQLTVVNRLQLPGGSTPDLVLLVVIAIALCGGPETGMIAGFCGGLSLDLAPPASQLIGQYALVFCVIGYGCGKLRGTLRRSALLPLVIAAGAALAGEALSAGVGMALDPAQVTWSTVRQVLPFSVLCDVVISSPVLYLVKLAYRWADDRAGDGSLEPRAARPAPRPRRRAAPRLRHGAGLAGSAARTQAARSQLSRTQPGRPVNLRLAAGRRPDRKVRSAAQGGLGTGTARRALPRIAFSGRSGRGSITGWPSEPGHRTFRLGTGRPARGPGFRPAARARGGSAADGVLRRPAAARPARLHLRPHGARHGDGVIGGGTLTRRKLGRRRRPAAAVRFGPSRPVRFGPGRPGRPGRLVRFGPRWLLGRFGPGRSGGFRPGRSGRFGPGRLRGLGPGRLRGLGPRRPVRFRSGHGSVLSRWTHRRQGRRSGIGRISSRRTGGPG